MLLLLPFTLTFDVLEFPIWVVVSVFCVPFVDKFDVFCEPS